MVYSVVIFLSYWAGVSLARISGEVQDRMVRFYYPEFVLSNVKYKLG